MNCIVFVSNELMLPGLHAALATCAATCKKEGVNAPIYVFHDRVSAIDIRNIQTAIARVNPAQIVDFRPVEIERYRSLQSLHGDHMTYMRFGLARILDKFSKILYIDSDMLVNEGVAELLTWDIEKSPFAASGVGDVETALEGGFYKELGYKSEDPSFNAGLLVLNADYWREHEVEDRCVEFGRRHLGKCRSADQTILNGLFIRDFKPLPKRFNINFGAGLKMVPEGSILHFVGSPKPWDIGGGILHSGYRKWSAAAKKGGYRSLAFWIKNGFPMLKRAWIIKRSVARWLLRKLKG